MIDYWMLAQSRARIGMRKKYSMGSLAGRWEVVGCVCFLCGKEAVRAILVPAYCRGLCDARKHREAIIYAVFLKFVSG